MQIPAELTVAYFPGDREFFCKWVLLDSEKDLYREFTFFIGLDFNRDSLEASWPSKHGPDGKLTADTNVKTLPFAERAKAFLVGQSLVPLGIYRTHVINICPPATAKEGQAVQLEFNTSVIEFPTLPLPLEVNPQGEAVFLAFFNEEA